MKALKIALVVLLILAVAFGIAAFIFPTEMTVEKSIEINAPKSLVHEHVSKFANIHNWSPWTRIDPNMKSDITGEDGSVGAVYSWSSEDGNVGTGKQEITKITEDSVITSIAFSEPFESVAESYIILEATSPTTTKVTWGFYSNPGRPANVFMGLMGAESSVGNDFQTGLDTLKVITEAAALDANIGYNGYDIEEITFDETVFAVTRDTIDWADMDAFFQTQLPAANEAVGKTGKQPGHAAGLYYTWDTENKRADLAVGVAYTPAGEVPGFSSVTVGGKALKVNYYGPYEGSEGAHNALESYGTEKGLTIVEPVIELYITDPATEPDTSKWLTEIYYLVQ